MAELNLDLEQSLQLRMAQFKSDPEKMQDVNDFLNDLFEKAQKEAELRNGTKSKGKLVCLLITMRNSLRNCSFSGRFRNTK